MSAQWPWRAASCGFYWPVGPEFSGEYFSTWGEPSLLRGARLAGRRLAKDRGFDRRAPWMCFSIMIVPPYRQGVLKINALF